MSLFDSIYIHISIMYNLHMCIASEYNNNYLDIVYENLADKINFTYKRIFTLNIIKEAEWTPHYPV